MTRPAMWLSLPQVAEQAGCAPSTVLHAITEGHLPSVQTGGRNTSHRIRRDNAHTWVLAYQATHPDALSKGSGAHQRWHVARGVTNPACRLCAAGQGAGQ